jgi:hypothetical protein
VCRTRFPLAGQSARIVEISQTIDVEHEGAKDSASGTTGGHPRPWGVPAVVFPLAAGAAADPSIDWAAPYPSSGTFPRTHFRGITESAFARLVSQVGRRA